MYLSTDEGGVNMAERKLELYQENPSAAQLINQLNDEAFITKFAEDPHVALKDSGIEMSLAEFTSLLSEDKSFYDLVTKKISEKVDITRINTAASSCCKTPDIK